MRPQPTAAQDPANVDGGKFVVCIGSKVSKRVFAHTVWFRRRTSVCAFVFGPCGTAALVGSHAVVTLSETVMEMVHYLL